jgi:hypothetical protein
MPGSRGSGLNPASLMLDVIATAKLHFIELAGKPIDFTKAIIIFNRGDIPRKKVIILSGEGDAVLIVGATIIETLKEVIFAGAFLDDPGRCSLFLHVFLLKYSHIAVLSALLLMKDIMQCIIYFVK